MTFNKEINLFKSKGGDPFHGEVIQELNREMENFDSRLSQRRDPFARIHKPTSPPV